MTYSPATAEQTVPGNSSKFGNVGAGHLYYFLEDVYPRISGRRWLKTPRVLGLLFGTREADVIPPHGGKGPSARSAGVGGCWTAGWIPGSRCRATAAGFQPRYPPPPFPPSIDNGNSRLLKGVWLWQAGKVEKVVPED